MSDLLSNDPSSSTIIKPEANLLVPAATVANRARTNLSTSPLSAALGGASNGGEGSTITTFFDGTPLKNFILLGLAYLGYRYIRRRF